MFSQKDGEFERKIALFLEIFPSSPLAWVCVSKGPIQGLGGLPEGLTWMIQLGKCLWLEAVTGLLSPGPPHEQHCWESGDTHVTRVGREQIAEKMETSLPVSEITAQRKLLLLPPVWERGEHSCGKHRGVTSQPHTSQQEHLGHSFYILNFSRGSAPWVGCAQVFLGSLHIPLGRSSCGQAQPKPQLVRL